MKGPPLNPLELIRPLRKVVGMSAVLLPFRSDGAIDWPGFRAHLARTAASGLVPAVNMDTGFVHLLDSETRKAVLDATCETLDGRPFIAGAFVADSPGSAFDLPAYAREMEAIEGRGGMPILFPSFGLTERPDDALIAAFERVGRLTDRFLAFELGTMFAPSGRIFSLEVYERILTIRSCVGAKHSSLSRVEEWRRLALRDRVRPDFLVLTGNDLAIDMVIYGSDYLLGLSTFAPDLFAVRDAMWERGDPAFFELNDGLQYLGQFAFRPPVPAYKHSAAMFLKIRGWIDSDRTHPGGLARPDSDRDVLREIADRLDRFRGA